MNDEQVLQEAARRGLLSEEEQRILDEAVRRGVIGAQPPGGDTADQSETLPAWQQALGAQADQDGQPYLEFQSRDPLPEMPLFFDEVGNFVLNRAYDTGVAGLRAVRNAGVGTASAVPDILGYEGAGDAIRRAVPEIRGSGAANFGGDVGQYLMGGAAASGIARAGLSAAPRVGAAVSSGMARLPGFAQRGLRALGFMGGAGVADGIVTDPGMDNPTITGGLADIYSGDFSTDDLSPRGERAMVAADNLVLPLSLAVSRGVADVVDEGLGNRLSSVAGRLGNPENLVGSEMRAMGVSEDTLRAQEALSTGGVRVSFPQVGPRGGESSAAFDNYAARTQTSLPYQRQMDDNRNALESNVQQTLARDPAAPANSGWAAGDLQGQLVSAQNEIASIEELLALTRAQAAPTRASLDSSTALASRVFGPQTDSIRGLYAQARDEMYDSVPDDILIPRTGTRAAAEQVIAENTGDFARPVPQAVAARAASTPGEDESLDELLRLFSSARADDRSLGGAIRATEDPNVGRQLGDLQDGLRVDMEAAEGANDALRAANANNALVFSPRFRDGLGGNMALGGREDWGRYLNRALGDPQEADRLAITIRGDDDARRLVRDFYFDQLSPSSGGATSNLTRESVGRFLDRNRVGLERFPDIRDELTRLQTTLGEQETALTRAQMDERAARGLAPTDDPTVGNTRAVGQYLRGESREAAQTAARSPSQAADIVQRLEGNPAALADVRNALRETLDRAMRDVGNTDATGVSPLRSTQMQIALEPGGTLRRSLEAAGVFTADEWAVLDQFRAQSAALDRTMTRAQGAEAALDDSRSTIISGGVVGGLDRLSAQNLNTVFESLANLLPGSRNLENLRVEAQFNPELARRLMEQSTPEQRAFLESAVRRNTRYDNLINAVLEWSQGENAQ